MTDRRFPPPWIVERLPGGFICSPRCERAIARYFYARENDIDSLNAKELTMDEARRIASNIAKLPTLLGKGG